LSAKVLLAIAHYDCEAFNDMCLKAKLVMYLWT